jgi:fimbrial isopeptide formation D2 family protein/uncharacterized repeat protein (TIGR01451 family)
LPSTLTYEGSSAVIKAGGGDITLSPTESGGKVKLYITEAQMQANEGEVVQLTIDAKVASSWESGSITNEAFAYYQTGTSQPDPDVDDPDEEDDVTLTPEKITLPSWDLQKSDNDSRLGKVGDILSYSVTIKIPADALDDWEAVKLVDPLPKSLTYQTGTATLFEGGVDTGKTVSYDSGANTLTVSLDATGISTYAGKTLTLKFQAKVNSSWNGKAITNPAELYLTPQNGSQPQDPNEKAKVTTSPEGSDGGDIDPPSYAEYKNLDIEKKADQTVVTPGKNISYTITVKNKGTMVLRDIIIIDLLPDYTKYVSSNHGGKYNQSKDEVVWKIKSLAPGKIVKLKLVLKTNKSIPADYQFKNTIKAGPNRENLVASSNTAVVKPTGKGVQTGDDVNVLLYGFLATVAAMIALGAVGLPGSRKRHTHNG